MRVLIIGDSSPAHIGGHMQRASHYLGEAMPLMDINEAYASPRLVKALWWHLLGHRPARLREFSSRLVKRCTEEKPDMVLTFGLAPVSAPALTQLRNLGVILANFATDDPWNPEHRAPWFMQGLPLYHHVFTPRHANEPELRALRGPSVHYLPFAYAPEIHFPPPETDAGERARLSSDLLFIGGADADRSAVMTSLQERQFNLSLWGGYWDRDPRLRPFARGHACPEMFRKLVSCAAINLCLVRRANRDGQSMRTFELPAVGGCLLVEDTTDHRGLFGADGECVGYFTAMDDLEQKARTLLAHPEDRARMARAAHQRISAQGRHTYADRLRSLLDICRP